MSFENLIIVGDRINPQGFKSVAKLIQEEDLQGLQELAVKQVEAGSSFIDVTVGPRAYGDIEFLQKVVVALQDAVDVPLCIDYPVKHIAEACLQVYDVNKSGGSPPLINSFAETRMEMFELLEISPCKIVFMTSEYVDENGNAKSSRTAREIIDVTRRLTDKSINEYGLTHDDIFIDIVVNSLVSDTDGRTKMALDAIRGISEDPELKGIHILGGLTNIGNMVPKIEFDGMSLRHCIENAFLTRAVPLGFDTVLGTPWNDFQPLPEDHEVLKAFDDVLQLTGLDAMRRLRELWAK